MWLLLGHYPRRSPRPLSRDLSALTCADANREFETSATTWEGIPEAPPDSAEETNITYSRY